MSAWQPFFGKAMDEKRYRQVLKAVEPVLEDGEYVTAILKLTQLSTGTTTLALTEHRLLAVGRSRVTRAAAARDVREAGVEKNLRIRLMVDSGAGPEHWGDVIDEQAVRARLLLVKGLPDAVRADLQAELDGRPTRRQAAAWAHRAEQDAAETQERRERAAAQQQERAERDAAEETWRTWDAIAGAHLRRQLLDALLAACGEDELPQTIIAATDPAGAAIAAFDDRCVLVTRSPLAGRWVTTVIAYAEITAIEFHAVELGGALEILTTTYHGARWTSHPPFTLANTLELPMRRFELLRPRIRQLQELAARAKPAA
jgi:hypothetical protein